MNSVSQARVRHIFIREFIRRGRVTWDMKQALRRVAGRTVTSESPGQK